MREVSRPNMSLQLHNCCELSEVESNWYLEWRKDWKVLWWVKYFLYVIMSLLKNVLIDRPQQLNDCWIFFHFFFLSLVIEMSNFNFIRNIQIVKLLHWSYPVCDWHVEMRKPPLNICNTSLIAVCSGGCMILQSCLKGVSGIT